MNIASEIVGIVREADWDGESDEVVVGKVATELEPVRKALRELFDKSDVNDGNYMEYEAAEQALARFEEE